MELEHFDFYGLKISTFQMQDLDRFISDTFSRKDGAICYGYSLGILPWFRKYPNLYNITNKSELILTDGRWLYNLLKLKRCPICKNLSIPEFVFYTLDFANKLELNVFLFGACEENNRNACLEINSKYPNIKVFGQSGYYNNIEEKEIIKRIADLDIDLVLVGLPTPQKEELSLKYKKQFKTSMIIPCGGMIDVLSGKITPSPSWLKNFGLASFFRVLQEPRRLFYKKFKEFLLIFFYILPLILVNVLLKNKQFSIPKILGIKN